MKILLFGANGQVGWELQRSLSPLGELVCCGRHEANLENLDELQSYIQHQNPQIIVNAAAYTTVDKAETDQELAYRINADAVEVMARQAKAQDALLVHYSTDYVFDGTQHEPIKETQEANPLSVYGLSKLKGDLAVQNSGCKFLIFRTSWVYAARGHNFVKTILRLAQERNELNIVADQTASPTGAELIADVTAIALQRILENLDKVHKYTGLYHLTASGHTNWHQYAKILLAEAEAQGVSLRVKPNNIKPIATSEYTLPASRPAYSILDTNKIREVFNISLPLWDEPVKRVVREMLGR
jgi:dTDP-4-dehydrorhamnose reductase